MRVKGFEFSLREFAGSLGDFGPLNPFIIGYIMICGVNPCGLFLMMGITNIIFGLVYRLPLPVEPKKAIGSVALAQKWQPSLIYGVGLGTGLIWLALATSGTVEKIAKVTPKPVIRGIQMGLAIILAVEGIELMKTDVFVALAALVVAFVFLKSKRFPAAFLLVAGGLVIAFLAIKTQNLRLGFYFPSLLIPSPRDVLLGLYLAGVAQIPLTLSNAVIATSGLVKDLFPKKPVQPRSLALNMGFLNTFTTFLGGIPLCHGAGGLAAQYLFGARTGGAMIMEGIVEIVLALLFAESVATVFNAFPLAIVGVMLLLAGIELGVVASDIRAPAQIFIMIFVALVSYAINLGIGFFAGLVLYYVLERRWIAVPEIKPELP